MDSAHRIMATNGLLEGPEAHLSDLNARVNAFERRMIVDALRQARGVQVKAAALLGIKERSLWHRIKKHQINIAEFKS